MEKQIACFGCGKRVGHLYGEYKNLIDSNVTEADAATELGLERFCCRNTVISSTNISEKVFAAGRPVYNELTKRTEIKDVGLYPERVEKTYERSTITDLQASQEGKAVFDEYDSVISEQGKIVSSREIEKPRAVSVMPVVELGKAAEMGKENGGQGEQEEKEKQRVVELPRRYDDISRWKAMMEEQLNVPSEDKLALLGYGSQHWFTLGWTVGESFETGDPNEQHPTLPKVFKQPLQDLEPPLTIYFNVFGLEEPYINTAEFSVELEFDADGLITGEEIFDQINREFQRPLDEDEWDRLLHNDVLQRNYPWYIYELLKYKRSGVRFSLATLRFGYLRFDRYDYRKVREVKQVGKIRKPVEVQDKSKLFLVLEKMETRMGDNRLPSYGFNLEQNMYEAEGVDVEAKFDSDEKLGNLDKQQPSTGVNDDSVPRKVVPRVEKLYFTTKLTTLQSRFVNAAADLVGRYIVDYTYDFEEKSGLMKLEASEESVVKGLNQTAELELMGDSIFAAPFEIYGGEGGEGGEEEIMGLEVVSIWYDRGLVLVCRSTKYDKPIVIAFGVKLIQRANNAAEKVKTYPLV
jgi:DNA-directed RNA polymerase subunit N (RpoN/RPB10)